MTKTIALLGFLLSTATMAHAVEVVDNSANYWLPHCKAFANDSISPFPGVCAGIVYGIGETLMSWGWVLDRCTLIPNSVTLGQKVRVVVKYIEERPQRMHETFSSLAEDAIVEAWPCKKESK